MTLLGRSEKDDTMRPPEGIANRARWLVQYLNAKFWDLSEIRVRAQVEYQSDATNRTVHGLNRILTEEAIAGLAGMVTLEEFHVHWFVRPADSNQRSDLRQQLPSVVGFVGLLYENELYNIERTQTALQRFGIYCAWQRVFIVVEPLYEMIPNQSRSRLLEKCGRGSQEIDMAAIGDAFRENMPEELKQFLETTAADSRRRMDASEFQELYDLRAPRFMEDREGTETRVVYAGAVLSRRESQERVAETHEDVGGGPGKESENPTPADGTTGSPVQVKKRNGLPEIQALWSPADSLPYPECFAQFNRTSSIITFNQDHEELKAKMRIIEYKSKQHFNGEYGTILNLVKAGLEKTLTDLVLGVLQAEDAGAPADQVEQMLSPATLTAAGLGRYFFTRAIQQDVVTTLKELRLKAA